MVRYGYERLRIPSETLGGDYRVLELQIQENDWIEGRTLEECKLDGEGVRVLGIYRHDGSYLGVPKGSAKLHRGHILALYGNTDRVRELEARRADPEGESAHEDAVRQECCFSQPFDPYSALAAYVLLFAGIWHVCLC